MYPFHGLALIPAGFLPASTVASSGLNGCQPLRPLSFQLAACFVGDALPPGTADAAPFSALAVAAAGARPSRRDALGRAPAVVFALLFAISPSVQSRRTTRRHCHDPATGLSPAGVGGLTGGGTPPCEHA